MARRGTAVRIGALLAAIGAYPAWAYVGPVDEQGRFPFVVEIQMDGTATCTGVLVDRRKVLTSAHCIVTRNVKEMLVKAGKQQVRTRNLVPHPDYVDREVTPDPACACEREGARHDIAVVHLPTDLIVSSYPTLISAVMPDDIRKPLAAEGKMPWAMLRYVIRSNLPDLFNGDSFTGTLVGHGHSKECKDRDAPGCALDGKRRFGTHEISRLCHGDVWCVTGKGGMGGDSGGPLLFGRKDGSYLVAGIYRGNSSWSARMTFASTLLNAPFLKAQGVIR